MSGCWGAIVFFHLISSAPQKHRVPIKNTLVESERVMTYMLDLNPIGEGGTNLAVPFGVG